MTADARTVAHYTEFERQARAAAEFVDFAPLFECQNCRAKWIEEALDPIKDLWQRVAPGEPMPAGECPACGCLCHEVSAPVVPGPGTHEYLFDVKLFASIRVRAASESEARAMLREHINCASANFGAWPDGSPIVAEASVDDDEMPLIEIDGDPV